MAVEIFTVSNTDGETHRSYGNDVTLAKSSAVFFGKSAPGIAYYEKAGSDLQVTLLDGQEVTLRNFFVIDAQGDFNRLELGQNGPTEVTGMLAPEPEIPDSGQIEPVHAAPETPQPAHTITPAETTTADNGDTSASDAADTGGMFGASIDQVIFGLATGSIALAAVSGFSDSNSSDNAPNETEDGTNTAGGTDASGDADATGSAEAGNGADTGGSANAGDGATTGNGTDSGGSAGSGGEANASNGTDAKPVESLLSVVAGLLGLDASGDSAQDSSMSGGLFDQKTSSGSATMDSAIPTDMTVASNSFDELIDGTDSSSGA
jgi:hypothetical protein